jgi:hypothetical protein
MASTFQGLGDLKKRIADREERINGGDHEKAVWFSTLLKNSQRGVLKIRFMQELSPEAALYKKDWGTYLGAIEHIAPGPQGFRSRALDTLDTEQRDWAQEQHIANPRLGWGPKENFYITVAVESFDVGTGEKVVVPAILSRPIGSDFVTDIIKINEDSEGEGISGKTYWLTRSGTGTKTKWTLSPEEDPDKQISFDGIEPYDLKESAVIHVPYEKQEAFYMRNADIAYAQREADRRAAERAAKNGNGPSDFGNNSSDEPPASDANGVPTKKFKW